MNLSDYRKISPALYADLTAAFTKHGLKMGAPRAIVDPRCGTVTLKVDLADTNHKAADGSATTPEAEYFKEYCRQMGALTDMKVEWLNDTFSASGNTYRLAGMARGKKKNSMLIERQSDKSIRVTSEEQIVLHFIAKGRRAGKAA